MVAWILKRERRGQVPALWSQYKKAKFGKEKNDTGGDNMGVKEIKREKYIYNIKDKKLSIENCWFEKSAKQYFKYKDWFSTSEYNLYLFTWIYTPLFVG